jgi:oxygen-independent coproporphyrinogen-3 oxidase
VNFDLIYGLPLQTPETVERTIERTIELSPDRIAYYLFAQIPDKIAVQRGLDYTRLPDSQTKLVMFLTGLRRFTEAGYQFIGLDHFAKPDEPLAQARNAGTLQRNFQGMTTGGGLDLIGIGASSISHLAQSAYLQNVREATDYEARIESDGCAIYRGKRFSNEDVVRQAVLSDWYCLGGVDPQRIAERFDIVFEEYFARELDVMRELADEGLVCFEPDGRIAATMPLGRVLKRTIGAVFDGYLAPDAYRVGDRQYFSANA